MKSNVFILSIIMFIIVVCPVFTQNVEYVDIEETGNEIDEKKAENQELIQTVADLRKENKRLEGEINLEYKWVYRISEVISSMETLIKSLEYMSENTTNEDYQAKLQEMIDVNKNKIDMLRDRQDTLHKSIKNRKLKVDQNDEQIRNTNETIAKNENRILYLKVARDRTEALENTLELYSKRIDAMIELLDAEVGEIKAVEVMDTVPGPEENEEIE